MEKSKDIKWMKLRLLKDNVNSLNKGWLFHMTKTKAADQVDYDSMYCISEYKMNINWREELGEVNYSRINNIDLGASLVHNALIKPGEVFSLRRIIGDATLERGFREGPVIKNGVTTTTIGGGLCLVSSILFNVVLLSNIEILEKYNHSTDLWGEDRFVGLGLDATYVFGAKDLKFRNNHGCNILIRMGVNKKERYLWCKAYSEEVIDHHVDIMTQVLEEYLPETIIENKEYRKGWKVETKRLTSKKAINYESTEVYHPFYL